MALGDLDSTIDTAAAILRHAKHVLVFTAAGVSAESGIGLLGVTDIA